MRASGRRESDMTFAAPHRGSLSGELLGKFSAIVRRGSHFRSNNNGESDDEGLVSPAAATGGGGDLLLEATPSTTNANKGFGFNFAANMRRFSKASGPPVDDAATFGLRRMMGGDEPERQRRYDLEIMSFASLHDHFQPVQAPEVEDKGGDVDDNQVEEELQLPVDGEDGKEAVRRKSREMTADADEYVDEFVDDEEEDDDDEEDHVLRLRLKSRQAMTSEASMSRGDDEDDEAYGDDDDNDAHDDARELNFDQANLGASVRKLVRQIESASFSDDAVMSNQDEDDRRASHHHEDEETKESDAYGSRHSDPLAEVRPAARRVTYPMVVNSAYRAPTTRVMGQSCYIPMDEVQEDLTKSVRRLVIGLKKEAEEQDAPPPSGLPFVRRRGNSCPPPYCPPTKSSAADSSASTAASITMDMGPSEPPRWRKRSALARLAPKFFDNFRRKRKSYLYTDEELESIEGARWKIVELAFRFGGKHRFYLVQAVNMFFPLTKYGRHGGPHPTRLHCNRCGTLQWQHKRGGLSEAVDLADVLQIIEGRQTAVFRKYSTTKSLDGSSLSLIFKERTLDLETQSSSHRDWLMSALRTLVAYARKQRQAEQRAIAERALLPMDDASEATSLSRSRVDYLARISSPHGSNVGPMMLW